MSVAIHWFRRDLRLSDNTALNAAAAAHDELVPVYIVSEWHKEHHWTGAPRQEFLCGCLASLAKNLETKGGRLIVRHGRADKVFERLVRETEAEAIYFNRDPDPFGRSIEETIYTLGSRLGIAVHAYKDIALHERDEVLTGSKSWFRVFTPYAKAWRALDKQPPGKRLARIVTPHHIVSDPLPTLSTWKLKSSATTIEPGEAAARKRLRAFLDGGVQHYATLRDIPARDGTSRLSQDLRHGTLSIRELYAGCQVAAAATRRAEQRRSVETYVSELIWREFYTQVLWFNPGVLDAELQEETRTLAWHDHWRPEDRPGGESFQRWCRGETGFPIVDAGMRQLNVTGFMHNRVRMIAAMFLTKDLHIWWMHGESYFMQRLVDGEIASNNGGWQWSASTGTDAAPYFRIQNPWLQAKRFDPQGDYIKRWIPELRDVSPAKFFAPPDGASSLAKGYPPPMVDHAREREVTLEMFRASR